MCEWNLWKFPILKLILSRPLEYRRSISVEGSPLKSQNENFALNQERERKVVPLLLKFLILRQ